MIHSQVNFRGTKRRAFGALFAFEQTLCEFEHDAGGIDIRISSAKLTIDVESKNLSAENCTAVASSAQEYF